MTAETPDNFLFLPAALLIISHKPIFLSVKVSGALQAKPWVFSLIVSSCGAECVEKASSIKRSWWQDFLCWVGCRIDTSTHIIYYIYIYLYIHCSELKCSLLLLCVPGCGLVIDCAWMRLGRQCVAMWSAFLFLTSTELYMWAVPFFGNSCVLCFWLQFSHLQFGFRFAGNDFAFCSWNGMRWWSFEVQWPYDDDELMLNVLRCHLTY